MLAVAASSSTRAMAEARLALLIGNEAYSTKVGRLQNPHNDVAVVGRALRALRFQVTEVKDADYRSVDAAIKRHVASVRREGAGAVSFVYYSGHGAADPDTKINYLIPVDVANADDEDLWTYSLNLNKIVESLREQAPAATHYVVFDACRNELNLTRKGRKALTDKGFAPIAYTPGVMIAYATAPGKTAADSGVGGGPYARVLADEIVKPGVEALTMFRRVALRVNREIGQDPWMSASTLPEFYFAGETASAIAPPRHSEAAEAWDRAKESMSIGVLEAFIARYKNSFYADLARARVAQLNSQVAIATSPGAQACAAFPCPLSGFRSPPAAQEASTIRSGAPSPISSARSFRAFPPMRRSRAGRCPTSSSSGRARRMLPLRRSTRPSTPSKELTSSPPSSRSGHWSSCIPTACMS